MGYGFNKRPQWALLSTAETSSSEIEWAQSKSNRMMNRVHDCWKLSFQYTCCLNCGRSYDSTHRDTIPALFGCNCIPTVCITCVFSECITRIDPQSEIDPRKGWANNTNVLSIGDCLATCETCGLETKLKRMKMVSL